MLFLGALATYQFIVLLISFISGYKPTGILCCGLFGGSFNRPIDGEILWKIKTLGMFNQSRGEHSCGIYNGNTLVKGADANRKFLDFVINVGVPPNDGTNNVFIGHTRFATIGSHSERNAHPFNIDDKIIMAHNGKIEDFIGPDGKRVGIWDYGRRAGLNTALINVDSELLGHLLAKTGPKVLNNYIGYAALLVHKLAEPGVLYVYHGASKNYSTGPLVEERPLFYMKTPEGVYMSSLKEALSFIRNKDTDAEPDTVAHNKVYRIKNGKIMGTIVEIHRENANATPYFNTWNNNNNTSSTSSTMSGGGTTATYPKTQPTGPKKTTTSSSSTDSSSVLPKRVGLDISNETIPKKALAPGFNGVYNHRNRYHMPDGTLCEGVIVVDKAGNLTSQIIDPTATIKRTVLYFYKGVMIKDKKSYDYIIQALSNRKTGLGLYLTDPEMNFALYLSKFSKYPITNMADEAKDVTKDRNLYYLNGKAVNSETITPVFSDRHYRYREGLLTKVEADVSKGTGGIPETEFFLQFGKSSSSSDNNNDNKKKEETQGGGRLAPSIPLRNIRENGLSIPVGHRFRDANLRTGNSGANNSVSVGDADLEEIKKSFYKVFNSIDEIADEFTGYNYVALRLYAMELCETILNNPKPDDSVIEALINDLYTDAVSQGVTLEELLDKNVYDIDFYIVEAIQDEVERTYGSLDGPGEDDDNTNFATETEEVVDEPAPSKYAPPAKLVSLYDDRNFHSLNQQEDEDFSNAGIPQFELVMQQEENAVEILETVVEYLESTRESTAPLNQLELSTLAEEAAKVVLDGIDEIKKNLIDVASKYRKTLLVMDIKRTMSNHANTI